MYPPVHAAAAPDRPAMVLAGSGATQTYAELADRSARLATWLRRAGLVEGDRVVIALPNDLRWGEIAWACWRTGLVLCAVNWHLSARELAPLMEDAAPRVVVTSVELAPTLRAAAGDGPRYLVVGESYDAAVAGTQADSELPETMGGRLLFSSGTTGRPKPFEVPPAGRHPEEVPVRSGQMMESLGFEPGACVYLSTGPAYHAAPLGFLQSVHQLGGTVVLMERFDAEDALAAIERHRVTHSQWVPTMFVRLLRLPDEVRERYDLCSHQVAVHGAAPCAPEVKKALIDWWGPIVHEYYGASEGYGRTAITAEEWLAHPGSVGRSVGGALHVTDEEGRDLPTGEVGTVWFVKPDADEPVRSADGAADLASTRGWGAVGDLGRLDADGYLYLTGRKGQTIISGGVNIYPREIEDVLVLHPAVADVAVIGVPEEEFGEQVKGVVGVAAGYEPTPELAAALISYCRDHLASFKCPRSIDFVERVPRSDAGKILMAELRGRYHAVTSR
ncbi:MULTISPECIES: AMP-binding protein [Pseudonocardia]|uniref:Bile acid-coenzyme A ligase n=2 Tax=Pseudonocardia TaxID=1847 RepID=A0A1Y2MQ53_PSEAH|nr:MULTISPECIES: AMP-binding protein [Pseudonocardia]OSY37109.1 Bile acid-coenzyme A ligase [Pseudonocardia autotrophica]TDN72081.1 fatty-acyl-CoA synthase [Pseudonocardia autotrophica]BBG02779.1 putative acyl-CoA ligase [Pseudonocardia autotrophica]GEC25888.1 putative acyl-CoA ligase [Pseudonocardia saturnea]